MADDDLVVGARVDLDVGSLQAAINDLTAALQGAFRQTNADTARASQGMRGVRVEAAGIERVLSQVRREAGSAFGTIQREVKGGEAQLERFRLRAEAIDASFKGLRTTTAGLRLPTELFGGLESNAQQAQQAVNKLEAEFNQFGTISEENLKAARVAFEGYGRVAKDQVPLVQGVVKSIRDVRRQSDIQENQQLRASLDQQTALVRSSGKEQVVAAQAAGQQRLAATQFVFKQIAAAERGLSAVVRTSVRGISSTLSGIGSAGSGVFHKVFARQNQEVIAGGNLVERSLRETIRTQNTILAEGTRQQAVVAAARARTQTGVLGAANRSGAFGGLLLGAGAIAAARDTFKVGSEFTRGLAVVQAQLGLTAETMAEVRQLSLDLGNDISLPGVSALDAAQAIGLLSKQFANLGDQAVIAAQAAGKGTLQLARATGVTAEDAAQVVGAAVNVFGVNADRAVAVADQITGAVALSGGSFSEFSDAFRQGAAVFNQFVGPAQNAESTLADFNTAIAVLRKQGIIGSDAGTSLKQFFLQANREADGAKEAMAALTARAGETGTAFFTAAGDARPFQETLAILRKGLVGLTDAQRSSTLQTLFGSDAVRAATVLTQISTEEFTKLSNQVRIEGLAAKIAAAQNTGLKGAVDALSSVIETAQIVFYEFVQGPIAAAVLGIATLTTKVLFADGAFATIRKALEGAAIGLGALLVAKTAAEGIALLAGATKLLLTPMGALAVTAAVVGAAIFLINDDTSKLGDTLRKTRDQVVGFTNDLLGIEDLNANGLNDFGDTMIFAKEKLDDARVAVRRFVVEEALPRLREFVTFAREELVPIARRAGDAIEDGFDRARDGVRRFWAFTEPFLRPAIDGFKGLAGAIEEALQGNFGGLGAGAVGALQGIGGTVSLAAQAIFANALKPLGAKVLETLKGVFTIANVKTAFGGLLKGVEFIGRQIGNILTDPITVKVALAVGIAAVTVGASFLKGFAKGVISNLPGLLDLGSDIVETIAKGLISNPSILVLGAALALAFRKVAPLLRTAGSGAGTSFTSGLKSSFGGGGFFGALFGGSDTAFRRSAATAINGVLDDIRTVQRQLRILGSTTIVNPRNIEDARKQLKQLSDVLTPAQQRALALRDTFAQAHQTLGIFRDAAGGVRTGLGQMVSGFVDAGRKIGTGFSNSMRTVASSLAGIFSKSPQTGDYSLQGQKIGTSVVGGIGTGLRQGAATIGSSLAGAWTSLRAQAAANGTSIGTALGAAVLSGLGGFMAGKAVGSSGGNVGLTALTTGLTAGLITGNPLIGAATGALTLLGGALGNSSRKAKEFKDNMSGLATAIETDLQPTLKALNDGLITMQDALGDVAGLDAFAESFKKVAGRETIDNLDALGFSIRDIQDAVKDGPGGIKALQSRYIEAARAAGRLSDAQAKIIQQLIGQGSDLGTGALQDAFPSLSGTSGEPKLTDEVFQLTGDLRDLNNVVGASGGLIVDAATDLRFFGDGVDGASFATNRLKDAYAGAVTKVADFVREQQNIRTEAIDDVKAKVAGLGADLDVLGEKYRNALNPPTPGDLQNQLVIDIAGVGSSIANVAADGISGVVETAQYQTFLDNIKNSAGDSIAEAVRTGLITDPSQVQGFLDPVRQGLIDTLKAAEVPQDVIDDVIRVFDNIPVTLNPSIAPDAAKVTAEQFSAAVQAYLEGKPFSIPSDLTGEEGTQYAIAVTAAAQAALDGNPVKPSLDGSNALTDGAAVGRDFGSGVATGIGAFDIVGKVKAAAAGIARRAKEAAEAELGIASPSKVGIEIGGFFAEGIAIGIADGADNIASAVGSAMDGAIAQARSAADVLAETVREATAQAFSRNVGTTGAGGSSALSRLLADAQFTDALASLRAGLDQEGATTSLTSGDPNGTGNLRGIAGALDAIAGVAEDILAGGGSAQEAADAVRFYVDALERQTDALGFQRSQVQALVEAFGLGNAAMAEFVATTSQLAESISTAAAAEAARRAKEQRIQDILAQYGPLIAQLASTINIAGLGLDSIIPGIGKTVNQFLAEMGLSLQDAQRIVQEAQKANQQGSSGSSSDANGDAASAPSSLDRPIFIENNIYPVTDDPEAIAMKVSNRQAAQLMRIG